MTRDEEIERIEKERKARERALLLLLLFTAERSRVATVRAIRVGADWRRPFRAAWLGDTALDQAGGVPMTSRIMADAQIAGYQRAGRLVGVDLTATVTLQEAAIFVRSVAEQKLYDVAQGLQDRIAQAITEQETADLISADVAAVNETFAKGWTLEHKADAEAESSRIVLEQYATGIMSGFKQPTVAAKITGLRFVAVLDNRTTVICRKYNGVMLPLGDPWFNTRTPPLHYNCRSLLLPITTEFEPTVNPPVTPPPEPGFGAPWSFQ